MAMTGGCLCGAVRYVANAPPISTRICWCRLCQHFAAGNGSVNVVFPRDGVAITGETRRYSSIADSGSHLHRSFCPQCGVQLFSQAEERPKIIVIRVGTLDDPTQVAPESIIWTSA